MCTACQSYRFTPDERLLKNVIRLRVPWAPVSTLVLNQANLAIDNSFKMPRCSSDDGKHLLSALHLPRHGGRLVADGSCCKLRRYGSSRDTRSLIGPKAVILHRTYNTELGGSCIIRLFPHGWPCGRMYGFSQHCGIQPETNPILGISTNSDSYNVIYTINDDITLQYQVDSTPPPRPTVLDLQYRISKHARS